MPRIQYIARRFGRATRAVIDHANQVIEEYQEQGFRLTLRQLFYQFVARGWLPNQQNEYKRLGSLLGAARNAGLVDWEAIEDRTRNIQKNNHWDSPADILECSAAQFRYDTWQDQPHRVEVWIEKDALVGVFKPTCEELDVPILSCRGYTSLSEMWVAGRRLRGCASDNQQPVILHFGDLDPSGSDMTRDIRDRLSLYAGMNIRVDRLALNLDQIETYNPPPNPAKSSDTRYATYVEVHGEQSWELDALEPPVIAGLIEQAVKTYRDEDLWVEALRHQQRARDRLQKLADTWEE